MHIFFSAGEPSGDLHGGNLIDELKRAQPDIRCSGFGGPRMQAAGCELLTDLTELAVMWFAAVLLHLPRFWRLLRQADVFLQTKRPDAVVLIDYPGFNWWVARRARRHNIPVFYYGTPQMWAWAGWRVHKLKRLVDHVLCKLPFEVDWFRERGCDAHYVGHPYFDELGARRLDDVLLSQLRSSDVPLVTILPGSRRQEVQRNLPQLVAAAKKIQQQVPNLRVAIASYNQDQANLANEVLDIHRRTIAIDVHIAKTPELIAAAKCCLACSGSVSLELLYHARPSVILYHISRFAYFIQNKFRTVRYITLANLLAEDEIYCRAGHSRDFESYARRELPFPEFITCEDESDKLAQPIVRWLTDQEKYVTDCEFLQTLRNLYAENGASQRAAQYILQQLSTPETVGSPTVDVPTRRAG